jgi:hypothetical protein
VLKGPGTTHQTSTDRLDVVLPHFTSQVPDPSKFPNGFKAVADFIHGVGMKSGLYTAKGPHTCQKRAASCLHEAQDAKNWAAWGIDYVKVCSMMRDTSEGIKPSARLLSRGCHTVVS